MTSRAVVDRVQRLVRPAKAGHAGTLDPLATGVLVICVGQATKLIRFVQQMPKQYRATFLLGHHSETDDTEGEIVEIEDAIVPTRADVDRVLPQFVGDIEQCPPAHSAIKIGGRRAYKLARKGADFEIAARTVTVQHISVERYEYPDLELDIKCGSGTYVRSLGRDIGAALGTAAVMSALERSAIGPFRSASAVALDHITLEIVQKDVQPALSAVSELPSIALTDLQLIEIRHGRPISFDPRPNVTKDAEWSAVNAAGELVAILREKCPGQLWPESNFE